MARADQRAHLEAAARFLIAHEGLIHYAQRRPMTTRYLREQETEDRFLKNRTISMDCSEAVTLLCRWAGLEDPNGRNYDGAGYTGTLLAHLPHYSDADAAETGALVVYGPGTGDHVCMVLDPGKDPLLFSHGQERGPVAVHHSVEKAWHRPPAIFLSIESL